MMRIGIGMESTGARYRSGFGAPPASATGGPSTYTITIVNDDLGGLSSPAAGDVVVNTGSDLAITFTASNTNTWTLANNGSLVVDDVTFRASDGLLTYTYTFHKVQANDTIRVFWDMK